MKVAVICIYGIILHVWTYPSACFKVVQVDQLLWSGFPMFLNLLLQLILVLPPQCIKELLCEPDTVAHIFIARLPLFIGRERVWQWNTRGAPGDLPSTAVLHNVTQQQTWGQCLCIGSLPCHCGNAVKGKIGVVIYIHSVIYTQYSGWIQYLMHEGISS